MRNHIATIFSTYRHWRSSDPASGEMSDDEIATHRWNDEGHYLVAVQSREGLISGIGEKSDFLFRIGSAACHESNTPLPNSV
jgi:hypothetical protein